MTPQEHAQQRDAVRLSLMLAPIHADRRDRPLKRRTTVAEVVQYRTPDSPVHVFVVPVVTERKL